MEQQSVISEASIFGRESEIELILQALKEAKNGKGSAWIFKGSGDCGYKTILRQAVKDCNCKYYHTICHPSISPMSPFRLKFYNFFKQFAKDIEQKVKDINPKGNILYRGTIGRATRRLTKNTSVYLEDGSLENLVMSFARELLKETPVVVLIEDLEWADVTSLEFLKLLMQNLNNEPVVFFATCNPDAIHEPSVPIEMLGKKVSAMQLLQTMETTSNIHRKDVSMFLREIEDDAVINIIDVPDISEKSQLKIVEKLFGKSLFSEFFLYKVLELGQGNGFYLTQIFQYFAQNLMERSGKKWKLRFPEADLELPSHIEHIIQGNLDDVPDTTVWELKRATLLPPPVFIEDWWKTGDLEQETFEKTLNIACEKNIIQILPDGEHIVFNSEKQKQILNDSLSKPEKEQLHTAIAEYYTKKSSLPCICVYYWNNSIDSVKALDFIANAGLDAEKLFCYEEAAEFYQEGIKLFPESEEMYKDLCKELDLKADDLLDKFLGLLKLYRVAALNNPKEPLLSPEARELFAKIVYKFTPDKFTAAFVLLVLFLMERLHNSPKSYNAEEVVYLSWFLYNHVIPGRDYANKIFLLKNMAHIDEKSQRIQTTIPKLYEKWGNSLQRKARQQAFVKFFLAAFFAKQHGDSFNSARILHRIVKLSHKHKESHHYFPWFEVEALRKLGEVYFEQASEDNLNYIRQATFSYIDAANLHLQRHEVSWLSLHLLQKANSLCEKYYVETDLLKEPLRSAKNKYELMEENSFESSVTVVADEGDVGAVEVIFQAILKDNRLPKVHLNTNLQDLEEPPQLIVVLAQAGAPTTKGYEEEIKRVGVSKEEDTGWFVKEDAKQTIFYVWENTSIELFHRALQIAEENILRSYT